MNKFVTISASLFLVLLVPAFASCEDAFLQIEAEEYSSANIATGTGIQWNGNDISGNAHLEYLSNGDYVVYRCINFGKPSTGMQVRVTSSSQTLGGDIEIYVDNDYAGKCTVPDTGGWDKWTTIDCPISISAGQHAIKLRFVGEMKLFDVNFTNNYVFNVNWFKFTNEDSSTETPEPESSCTDSDNGRDYLTKGTVSAEGRTKTDYCRNEEDIIEYYCEGERIYAEARFCDPGYAYCENGVCVGEIYKPEPQPVCVDTDGGKDYSVKGIVSVGPNTVYSEQIILADRCGTEDRSILSEVYCYNDNYWSLEHKKCENGCYAGTCIDEPTESVLDGYVSVWFTCYDGLSNHYIGKAAYCRTADDLRNMAEEFCGDLCNSVTGKCGVNTLTIGPDRCELGLTEICVDTDEGFNSYEAGTASSPGRATQSDVCQIVHRDANGEFLNYENVDECDSSVNECAVDEYLCDFLGPDQVAATSVDLCPRGCKDGACIKGTTQPTTQMLPSFIIAIHENSPSSDVTLATDIGRSITAEGYTGSPPEGISKLYSEITNVQLSNQITLALCRGEANLIYPDESLTYVQLSLIKDIENILGSKGISVGQILADEISSIYDLCKEVEGDTQPTSCPSDREIQAQTDKCKEDELGIEKKVNHLGCIVIECVNKETVLQRERSIKAPQKLVECSGCQVDDVCLPISIRKDGQYCSIDKEMKDQQIENTACENNFECTTNVCVNDSCVSGTFIQRFIAWLSALF